MGATNGCNLRATAVQALTDSGSRKIGERLARFHREMKQARSGIYSAAMENWVRK